MNGIPLDDDPLTLDIWEDKEEHFAGQKREKRSANTPPGMAGTENRVKESKLKSQISLLFKKKSSYFPIIDVFSTVTRQLQWMPMALRLCFVLTRRGLQKKTHWLGIMKT
jgi:hypothetical protein